MIFGLLLICISVWFLFFSPYSQICGRVLWRLPTTEKIIALTFDDGPNEPYTAQLLDILQKHGVQATFFVVGENAKKEPTMVKRIVEEGHTIGNHSTNHIFKNYFADPSFEAEIQQTQKIVQEITGVTPQFFRSPWLFRTPTLLRTVKKLGLQPVWGIFGSELEIFQPTAEKMVGRALQKARPGTIYIFHDGYNNKGGKRGETLASIDLLIPQLRAQGYTFITLTEWFSNNHST